MKQHREANMMPTGGWDCWVQGPCGYPGHGVESISSHFKDRPSQMCVTTIFVPFHRCWWPSFHVTGAMCVLETCLVTASN